MKRFRDIVRYPKIIVTALLFLGGLFGAHLVLPYVVNTQEIRQLLISRAAAAYGGEVRFAKFKPGLLPMPHVRISEGRLSDGDRIDLQIPDAAIYLKILPLFAGKVRVDRIKLVRPAWLVDIGQLDAMTSGDSGPYSERIEDLSPFIGFVGSAEAEIVDGRLDLRRNGRPVLKLSELNSRITSSGGQLHLHMSGRTDLDSGFSLDSEIDLYSLNSHGHLHVAGLQSRILGVVGVGGDGEDRFRTAADLDVEFRTDGMERIQATFDAETSEIQVRQGSRRTNLGDLAISGRAAWTPHTVDITFTQIRIAPLAMNWTGSVAWTNSPTMAVPPIQISLSGADVEIPPIRDFLLTLWKDQPVLAQVLDIVREGRIPSIASRITAPDWQTLMTMKALQVEGVLTGGRIVVPDDLFDLEQVDGRVVIADGRLTASGISARSGNATASNGALMMGLYDGTRAFTLDTLIDTELSEIPKALRKLTSNQAVLAQLDRLPGVTGRASGRLTIGDRLDRPAVDITTQARIKSGLSDLRVVGSIKDLNGEQPSASGFVKGRVGSQVLDWLVQMAGVPSWIAPKAPFTMTGAEIALTPSGQLRLNGGLQWDDGARIGAAMTVSHGDVHLQHLRIKDGVSDARISMRSRLTERLLDARFAGYLNRSSLDRLVESHRFGSGTLQGRFRIHYDQDRISRSAMDGELLVRDLKVFPGDGDAIHILEASLKGRGQRFDLQRMQMAWDESRISLAGGGVLTPQAVDVHGTVQADTFDTQKLLAIFDQKASRSSREQSQAAEQTISVRGKVKVEMGQLVHDRYRFVPLHAGVEFKQHETVIDVTQAQLCGIQMPGRIRIFNAMAHLNFSPYARASSLQDTGTCLVYGQNSEKLAGMLDLNGSLTSQGNDRNSLLANLKGEIDFSIEKGRITNVGSAGVFTNLLSYLSVNQYVKGDLPDLRKDDFAYNRIDSKWLFGDGVLRVDEGVLKSNAVNMVADGRYNLLSSELDLVVLVSPLTTVDWIVERIPILGNILQGTLVAIPVRIKGPGSDPEVVPLSPKAVGSRLGGILKRTIKTPVRIIEPLLKDDGEQDPEGE